MNDLCGCLCVGGLVQRAVWMQQVNTPVLFSVCCVSQFLMLLLMLLLLLSPPPLSSSLKYVQVDLSDVTGLANVKRLQRDADHESRLHHFKEDEALRKKNAAAVAAGEGGTGGTGNAHSTCLAALGAA